MKLWFTSIAFALTLLASSAGIAAERGSPDDAKAMAVKAAAYLKQAGAEKAFDAFNKDPAWHDRDLYVFVQDDTFTVRAHGAQAALIGRNFANLKDVDGKPFTQEMQAIKSEGWIDYKWQDPVTKKVEPKKSYGVRVGEYIVAVGAYAN